MSRSLTFDMDSVQGARSIFSRASAQGRGDSHLVGAITDGGGDWPALSAEALELISDPAKPAEKVGSIEGVLELFKVNACRGDEVEAVEVKLGIDDPVTCRFGGAPIVVLKQVPEFASPSGSDGGARAAVPDAVDGEKDAAGRRGGGDGPVDFAVVGHHVGFCAKEV